MQARKAGQALAWGVNSRLYFNTIRLILPGPRKGGCMAVLEIVKELISNVGFPIACVCMMFYQQEQERKAHKEESQQWVEALNRNTAVVEKVLSKLEG